MTSLNRSINTCIICGRHRKYTKLINDQTNIDEIHRFVRRLFGSHLPNAYHLIFYNVETQKFVILNQNELEYRHNPFRLDLSTEGEHIQNMTDSVQLYVINTADIHSQSEISCQEARSVDHGCSSNTVIKETEPQEDLPVNNNTTNDNDYHLEDLSHALLNGVSTDLRNNINENSYDDSLAMFFDDNQPNSDSSINNMSSSDHDLNPAYLSNALLDGSRPDQSLYAINNIVNDDNSNMNHSSDIVSNENQSQYDILFQMFENYQPESGANIEGLQDTSPNGIQADQSLPIQLNNNSLATIPVGSARPRQIHIPNSTERFNTHQCQVELNPLQNMNVNQMYFSLDVKPQQKKIYISDRFNQKVKGKINGYVARVQGKKISPSKRSSVWPSVHIPRLYQNESNVRLVVFVVSEKIQNGYRIWFKHGDRGFLPKGYTLETQSINPIEFDLNKQKLTKDDDFKLDLQMTTMWKKLTETERVYTLKEKDTIRLHPATHELSSPRLLCVLKVNQRLIWDTICLSDFIRPIKARKRVSSKLQTPA